MLETDSAYAYSKDMKGRSLLSRAAEEGHDSLVALLLATEGVDPNLKDDFGMTTLFYALKNECGAIYRLLKLQGPGILVRDIHGRAPLSYVLRRGNEAVLEPFIAESVDPVDGSSPPPSPYAGIYFGHKPDRSSLNVAIGDAGKIAIVYLLLEKGADIEARDNRGQTPLSWATSQGYTAIIQMLEIWKRKEIVLKG